ncbi:MAG: SpoIIE family protein phosphatase [Candidatus Eremiobacteraeota bacterium]|nr:SpoIIE family protein phosphatase [Candidatus Eremiobacteraeota bacterium]
MGEFRHHADDLPIFVWIQRPDGYIEWANKTWYDYVRLPHGIGTTIEGWERVIHPDDLHIVVDAFGTAISRQETYECEQRVKPSGGDASTYRWFLARSTPRFDRDGALLYWLGTGPDIHDSKMLVQKDSDSFRIMGDAVPQIMWSARPNGEMNWCNRRWTEYTGQSRGEAKGTGWTAIHHPSYLETAARRWAHSVATGEPFEEEFPLRGADGTFRWFLHRGMPLRDASGHIVQWYGTSTNIDAEHRLRLRDAFSSRAGERLARSLSIEETMETASRLAVPEFGDWAMIYLADLGGRVALRATYHRDEAKNAKAQTLIGREYIRKEKGVTSVDVIKNARPQFQSVVTREDLAQTVASELLPTFLEIGLGSVVIVPLLHAGKAIGTFVVVRDVGAPAYGERDVSFFELLASRIAPAIANAASYEREKRISRTFQYAAMHAELPQIPGFAFDAIYETGSAEALVGGDWYDAFRLGDGRIVLSVGDVAGSGLDAAVTMGSVRQSIRTAALINPEPVAVLDAVDRIVRAMGDDRFVTAFVGVLDPVHLELSYSSAGHPPPLLWRADGTIEALSHGDLPLGLRRRSGQKSSGILLESGCILAMYTDGLTECARDPLTGEENVGKALLAIDDPRHAARSIYRSIMHGGAPHDDVAIMTLAIETPTLQNSIKDWTFDALDGDAARYVRAELVCSLRDAGLSEDEISGAELVFGELLGNVVRYAAGRAKIMLDLTSSYPVLHVLDDGTGFEHNARLPIDPMQESGRGLFIASSLAYELTVSPRIGGGSHARAVIACHSDRRKPAESFVAR